MPLATSQKQGSYPSWKLTHNLVAHIWTPRLYNLQIRFKEENCRVTNLFQTMKGKLLSSFVIRFLIIPFPIIPNPMNPIGLSADILAFKSWRKKDKEEMFWSSAEWPNGFIFYHFRHNQSLLEPLFEDLSLRITHWACLSMTEDDDELAVLAETPEKFRNLRACLRCSLVKTFDQVITIEST